MSVLFPGGEPPAGVAKPGCFRDLNLDRIVEAVLAGREGYELEPVFWASLRTADEVAYRHEVFRDLEAGDLRAVVLSFAEEQRRVRRELELVRKQHYPLERQRWLVEAAARYTASVSSLHEALCAAEPASRGLRRFGDVLSGYVGSDEFRTLAADAREVLDALARVRYTLRIRHNRVTVGRPEDGADYGDEIERAFERFRRSATRDRLLLPSDSGSMDHVEAQIVERVARLHGAEFEALEAFCRSHAGFLDAAVARFDREIQFYLAWLEYRDRLADTGLELCLPCVATGAPVVAEGAFDLALAGKLAGEGGTIVRNGFRLEEAERIIVVTGPNQGGKTTFARMFGQLHHLARLGAPVPAARARLVLADEIHSHFERVEEVETLHGKLDDELIRIERILERATSRSVVIVNEIFASTALDDAVLLGTEVLERLVALGCVGVCVTFVDELAALGEATVSMVASVDPDDPSRRTFEIRRRPADGRAYAAALADKYGLSYERLRSRISP